MKKLELVKNSYSITRQDKKMDNRTKAEILVQFTQDEFNSGEYDEFFDYNDLGIPMAIAVTQDMVILTDAGEQLLDETWNELCLLFDANPDAEYESIDDLTTQ
jgi:hypothetical protein